MWVASGVCPNATTAGRQSWKDLIIAASQAQVMEQGEHKLAAPGLLTHRTEQLWNSGESVIIAQTPHVCCQGPQILVTI